MIFLPRRRPSRAMMVACLALFVALGGSSYASVAATIGSAQIIDNSIRSVDVHNGTLIASDFQPSALAAGFSTFKNQFRLTTAANALVEVARLNVPAGKYVAFAKLYTTVPLSGLNESVRCQLVAGGDFDETVSAHDAVTAESSLALNVVHVFTSAGSVVLNCGYRFASGDAFLGFIKISAIRVPQLSNVASP